MGRRKMEMKLIENKSNRQVTFSKRRNGLIKKARELSVLCDIDVALIIFSGSGRHYEFCSGNSLAKILKRHHHHPKAARNISTDVYEAEKYASFQTSAELVQIVERHLDEPNVEHLTIADLMQLENQLDAALVQIRSRKRQLMMESVIALHEQERMLTEENEDLKKQIIAMEHNKNNKAKANGVVIGFNHSVDNYMNCDDPQPSTLLLL